jgi:hypothetical protein
MIMLTNLTIVLDNRPGALAAVCEAIGFAGVSIEGLCCFASQGIALLYIAVEDVAAVRRVVDQIGLKVSEERAVTVVPVEDEPGAAGRILRQISDAGINLELAYLATGPRLVIGTNDQAKMQALRLS